MGTRKYYHCLVAGVNLKVESGSTWRIVGRMLALNSEDLMQAAAKMESYLQLQKVTDTVTIPSPATKKGIGQDG